MTHKFIHQPLVLSLLLLTSFFAGCAVWDFATVKYQNVIGYFNTYYNASSLYNEAIDELRQQDDNKDLMVEQHNPFILNVPPATIQKFDKIIEKCSRILNFYQKSKWVDNALLLIGKSFYFKQEFGRSERKFKELMETFPNSNLIAETQLWLGKTYFMMERDDEAVTMIEKSIQTASGEDQPEVIAEAYFTLGDMTLFLNKRVETVDYYRKGVQNSSDNQRKARIQFLLARQEEKLENKKAARDAYLRVLDFKPNDKLKFQTEIQYVRLSRELGDIDAAFVTLVRMLQTPRYLEYEAQIQLNIAHTLAAYGDFKTALDQYRFVDTTYKGKPEAAEGYFSSGKIFEYEIKDFDNAYDNYLKSKFEYPGSQFALQGGKRSDDLAEYRRLRNQMYEVDTLLYYILHPDSLLAREAQKKIADSIALVEKINAGIDPNAPESGQSSQSSRRRPHGRNTGRVSLQKLQQFDPTQPPGKQQGTAQQNVPQNAPLYRTLDIKKLRADSVAKVLAKLRFDMGGLMYIRLQKNDSARYYYALALEGSPGDDVAAQAYYTMSQMSREEGDSLTAVQYEEMIISKYPFTPYAQLLMKQRNIFPPADSTTMARDAYNLAARHLEEGRYQTGITEMRKLIDRYPFSEQAIRARLAIGMTYEKTFADKENTLKEYRQIVKNNPNTAYAKRPKEILQAFDDMEKQKQTEAEAKKKESEHSKKDKPIAVTPAPKDSTNATSGTPLPLGNTAAVPVPDSIANKSKPMKKDPTQDPDFPLNPIPAPRRIPDKE